MADNIVSTAMDAQLADKIAEFRYDFLGLVMFLFPWGEPGTALAHKKGPERWQARYLSDLSAHMRDNAIRKSIGLDFKVWRGAVTSGHGVGKSALVAWLIICLMSTRSDARGTVTANTGNQLETKTWPELSKWHAMSINRHWFQWTASSFYFKKYPEEKRKNYMVNALTVSDENTEAFAGLHNESSAVFVIMDEAGGIRGKVWEVIDGALTDGEPFLFCFGNPTQPDGEFYDCFNKHKDMYYRMRVDSRSVSHTNKTALEDIIQKYGIESDEVKVRVLGVFPTMSYSGLFNPVMLGLASTRELYRDNSAAIIMAVDVARFGRDRTVIMFRQGNDARSFPVYEYGQLDNVQVADKVCMHFEEFKPDIIVIESVGPGVGVIDILRSRRYPVHEVHPGSAAAEFTRYCNKRTEYYAALREATISTLCISEHKRLHEDLTNVRYGIDNKDTRMELESKKAMFARDSRLPSPDFGDTLALTFAVKVARRDARRGQVQFSAPSSKTNYDPVTYDDERSFQ